MSLSSLHEGLKTSDAVAALAPWFHNLHLPDGTETAPGHPLGDFPRDKWELIAPHLPQDLSGWRVLDIGCNAGFYSFELARRGAQVTGIDVDLHYLEQAHWAAKVMDIKPQAQFRQMHLYELARHDLTYDLVWFMGVFYHLRYPQLALDIVSRITGRWLMFQTMTMPGGEQFMPPEDLSLDEREAMTADAWPKMAIIEKRVAGDPTNWWAPNHSAVEALLRSSGFRIVQRPAHEVYLCEVDERPSLGIDELLENEYRAATQQSWR